MRIDWLEFFFEKRQIRNTYLEKVLLLVLLVIIIFSFYAVEAGAFAIHNNVSSDLRIEENKTQGRTITSYYDEEGKLSFASDMGFAYKISEEISTHQETVEYIYYYDENGNLVENKDGYSIIKRTKWGTVVTEEYYDTSQKHIKSKDGVYAIRYLFDNDRVVEKQYLDFDLCKTCCNNGYSRVEFDYSDGILERYYDIEDKLVSTKGGYTSLHYYRDHKGRIYLMTYLDGNIIINNNSGFAIVRREYDDDNQLYIEMYYDANDEPIKLSDGQYGMMYFRDKELLLNKNKELMLNLKNINIIAPWIIIVFGIVFSLVLLTVPTKWTFLLGFIYVGMIIVVTLFRTPGEAKTNFELWWSYKQFFNNAEIRLEIVDNIWLFVPLGAFLSRLIKKKGVLFTFAFLMLFSVMIEITQYVFGVGLSEFDDIISNTVGGGIGILFYYSINYIISHFSLA